VSHYDQVGKMPEIPTVNLRVIKVWSCNEQFDWTDPRLGPGWQFNLYDAGNNLIDWGVTDNNSQLDFVNLLKNSSVRVEEVQKVDWVLDFPAAGYYQLTLVDPLTTVYFGNFELLKVRAAKIYDFDMDGEWDPEEHGIAGVIFTLSGTNCRGEPLEIQAVTDSTGWADFGKQYPGDYTVCVEEPSGSWIPTTPTCVSFNLRRVEVVLVFGNICTRYASFGTKGYWHNKNGLRETTLGDLAYVNSLLPWQVPSSYFGAGDEPIDGFFADGTPVAAANGDWGDLIAPAGTPWAEQSHFLVDANAGGDPREQLAQQLDAFIMNALHRLGGVDTPILTGSGWTPASDIIADAVNVWATGTASQQNAMAGLLDGWNNNLAVEYVSPEPCPVVYP